MLHEVLITKGSLDSQVDLLCFPCPAVRWLCPRSPALDLKDFPFNSINGVCNSSVSPEDEHFPLCYMCHLSVLWLSCLCPAAWAPLAPAGARSSLTSFALITCCLGVFASFFQRLSSRLEACPAANLVLGYKMRDGSKILRACQNSWLCSVNIYFSFRFVGFVLHACLYLHFSKGRELLSHLYLFFSLFTSHPFSSIYLYIFLCTTCGGETLAPVPRWQGWDTYPRKMLFCLMPSTYCCSAGWEPAQAVRKSMKNLVVGLVGVQ